VVHCYSDIDKFYFRLLVRLTHETQDVRRRISSVFSLLGNMQSNIVVATEYAEATQLIALNAVLSGVNCDDVGREFVVSSAELIKKTNNFTEDLRRIRRMTVSLESLLVQINFLPSNFALSWLRSYLDNKSFPLTCQRCVGLKEGLVQHRAMLTSIKMKYTTIECDDVRWNQLGGAVQQVVRELTRNLYALIESVGHVAVNAQILSMSNDLNRAQLVEIHKGILRYMKQKQNVV